MSRKAIFRFRLTSLGDTEAEVLPREAVQPPGVNDRAPAAPRRGSPPPGA
jgi:hypothetical protein